MIYERITTEGQTIAMGEDPSLEEMQSAVGGPIEALPLHYTKWLGITLYVNEEGRFIEGLESNLLLNAIGLCDIHILGDVVAVTENGIWNHPENDLANYEITDVRCTLCDTVLPTHSIQAHLDKTHPIHECPHGGEEE